MKLISEKEESRHSRTSSSRRWAPCAEHQSELPEKQICTSFWSWLEENIAEKAFQAGWEGVKV